MCICLFKGRFLEEKLVRRLAFIPSGLRHVAPTHSAPRGSRVSWPAWHQLSRAWDLIWHPFGQRVSQTGCITRLAMAGQNVREFNVRAAGADRSFQKFILGKFPLGPPELKVQGTSWRKSERDCYVSKPDRFGEGVIT